MPMPHLLRLLHLCRRSPRRSLWALVRTDAPGETLHGHSCEVADGDGRRRPPMEAPYPIKGRSARPCVSTAALAERACRLVLAWPPQCLGDGQDVPMARTCAHAATTAAIELPRWHERAPSLWVRACSPPSASTRPLSFSIVQAGGRPLWARLHAPNAHWPLQSAPALWPPVAQSSMVSVR